MKHTLPKFLLGCLLLAACSKSGTFDDRSTEQSAARIRAERSAAVEPGPAPMPADTLELDTLHHQGTN
ncbi:MAG: hypothetical protein EOO08_09015 [Chitinophagaceae bacterium]|nr:MAG: hypothetical protein EOO08_09015 [Chitinophagaceae bacterium]